MTIKSNIGNLNQELQHLYDLLRAMKSDAVYYPQLRLPDMQMSRLDQALAKLEGPFTQPDTD